MEYPIISRGEIVSLKDKIENMRGKRNTDRDGMDKYKKKKIGKRNKESYKKPEWMSNTPSKRELV